MMQPPGAPAAQTTGTLWRLLFRPLHLHRAHWMLPPMPAQS